MQAFSKGLSAQLMRLRNVLAAQVPAQFGDRFNEVFPKVLGYYVADVVRILANAKALIRAMGGNDYIDNAMWAPAERLDLEEVKRIPDDPAEPGRASLLRSIT